MPKVKRNTSIEFSEQDEDNFALIETTLGHRNQTAIVSLSLQIMANLLSMGPQKIFSSIGELKDKNSL